MKNNIFSTVGSILVIAGAITLSETASAQDHRWSLELRPGVNIPMEELGGVELGTGFGAELTIGYRFMEHLGAYAGWGWNQFSPTEGDGHFEETGYTFGLRFVHPISDKLNYMIGVGTIYNHIEVENGEGDITADTDHGFGWQAEAGIAIPLAERWMLTPSVRYRALSRDLTIGDQTLDMDLNYISAGLGIAVLF